MRFAFTFVTLYLCHHSSVVSSSTIPLHSKPYAVLKQKLRNSEQVEWHFSESLLIIPSTISCAAVKEGLLICLKSRRDACKYFLSSILLVISMNIKYMNFKIFHHSPWPSTILTFIRWLLDLNLYYPDFTLIAQMSKHFFKNINLYEIEAIFNSPFAARESSGPIRFCAVIRAVIRVYGICSFYTVTELQSASWSYNLNV